MSVVTMELPKPIDRIGSSKRRSILTELGQAVLIEETVPLRFVRRACVIISVGILAFAVWASLSTVHEVSRASGEITPSGFERVIQHLEGGVVRKIFVHAGDIVEEGDPLFLLDDATTDEDVRSLATQEANLLGQIEGLSALAEGREPDFAALKGADAGQLNAHLATFRTARTAQAERLGLLDTQIAQARSTLSTRDEQLVGLARERDYAEEDVKRIKELAKKGYATKVKQSERQNALSKVVTQLAIVGEQRRFANEQLTEATRNRSSAIAEIQSGLASKIQDLRARMATLEGEIGKKGRRQARLQVNSPVFGIVKDIDAVNVGAVVGPGESLATIVPLNEKLFAETRVPADQIGYIKVGLPAQVKISAYDFTRFGWIKGEVVSISPSAFQEPGRPAFYKIRINLDSDRPTDAPSAKIIPGMEVSADIITGEKTILRYLLSPIDRAFNDAFMER